MGMTFWYDWYGYEIGMTFWYDWYGYEIGMTCLKINSGMREGMERIGMRLVWVWV